MGENLGKRRKIEVKYLQDVHQIFQAQDYSNQAQNSSFIHTLAISKFTSQAPELGRCPSDANSSWHTRR